MKKINFYAGTSLLSLSLIFSGCHSLNNTQKGAGLGGGGGAALGAGIGALANGGKGAAWGAGIGAILGGAAGALIGNKMDKQKKELQKIQGAQVESVNNGEAIKVTFESGILFATNSSTLNSSSQNSLFKFAQSLKNNPQTNVQIFGHTDNTGNDNINVPLSESRAKSVYDYLVGQGVASSRMVAEGKGSSQPVADNSTASGRTQNRRVEVYITANSDMVNAAKQGTLQ